VNGLSIRSSRHASSSNRPSRIARRWRPTRSPTSLTPTPPSAAAILRQPMQSPRLRQSPEAWRLDLVANGSRILQSGTTYGANFSDCRVRKAHAGLSVALKTRDLGCRAPRSATN